ncbi:MAG: hypothetical protein JNK53_08805, partial [Phycisphaerae bacterium]|nr:hypothetical protein [Phycisphaerae bacterium]
MNPPGAGDSAAAAGDPSGATGDPSDAAPIAAAPAVGADGEPMADTPTGADATIAGAAGEQDTPWKSGMAASTVKDDGHPIGAPTRDGRSHQYELRAYGTRIEVYMDGQPVPADRIRMADQSVGVLDANGAVIERMDLPAGWTEDAQKATTPDPNDPFDFR